MTGPLVDVRGVVKKVGRVRALDGVTLTAWRGVTGLVGRNGAGKTTLLRILGTVGSADSGSVRLLGCDPIVAAERDEIRRRLGYLPEDAGLYRSFTAFAFIDYIAILKQLNDRRGRHDEVRRVLELVGLTEVAHRRIRSLSAGMRRRVGIAQALLGDPDLIVLDEPTAGLDLEQRLRFRDLLAGLAEDRCVVLSAHHTEDVEAICEQVVVLDAGRVRFAGRPVELTALAAGRVWASRSRESSAALSWRTGDGVVRNIGSPPPGAELLRPSFDDGYLLLLDARGRTNAAVRA